MNNIVARGVPRLGIVLVNWNRWEDTIECLESLFRSTIPVRVVVVDNGSTNDSLAKIAAWAQGNIEATAVSPAMTRFSTPPIPKPFGCVALDAAQAPETDPGSAMLTLIDGGGNLGFAAGNNLGLRHLLRDPSLDYFWLLNNDTVIETGAANALVMRMDATHRVGMCGTVVRYYHRPNEIQALNGSRFSALSGASQGIGRGQPITMPFDPAKVARETDFVLGASLGVSRRFIEVVGLMEESYFLYFEEIDWAYRNNDRFEIAFAHGAIVYHKEGHSIGSSATAGQRSPTAEYYLMRSRLAFVKRRQPLLLPVHWGISIAMIGRRLMRRQPEKAKVMTKALFGRPF